MSVRRSASRNVSTETSCAMSVSDRNALTLRPVALLDDAGKAVGHRLLEAAADVLDRLALAALGERLLGARERLLEHDDDEVVDDVGLRLGRTLSVVLGLQAHDLLRDHRSHLAQRLLIAFTHRSTASSDRHVTARPATERIGPAEPMSARNARATPPSLPVTRRASLRSGAVQSRCGPARKARAKTRPEAPRPPRRAGTPPWSATRDR